MHKVLFIDRDGTLIVEPPDEQIDSLEKLEFYPGVITWLGRIVRETDFKLVMVTNQDGLGTSKFPEETFWPAHEKMMRILQNEGIHFTAVHIDRSTAEENKPTRKPGTGMLGAYLTGLYDLSGSFVIGDRLTDVKLAANLGAKGILIGDNALDAQVDQQGLRGHWSLTTQSWEDIYRHVGGSSRTARVHRKTRETDIQVDINLDGNGTAKISTGLGFFDHMLEQVARHGMINLQVMVKGDLHIDEHHTIEDTALALGECVLTAMGSKRGISRYGFQLPMDDCLAAVSLDFGGRPWLVWDASFSREKIGEMPTEMFLHFFKSFSDASKCNLNIKAEGQNEHHKIEAIFKAFARAMRMALAKDGTDHLPSTKGTL
ncbi:MAG: bifunctional histidinol-phosphatase/imidazoleglycerol-phosphate dehydratase HisB [Cyclobacteriaceae bacterium]